MQTEEKEMSFLEHLEEMRGTILRCLGVFAVALVGVLIFFGYFNSLMMQPLKSAKALLAAWSNTPIEDLNSEDKKFQPTFIERTVNGERYFFVADADGKILKPGTDTERPWYDGIKLRAMTFATPIVVWFYVGFLGALGFSLPIMFYFIAKFVAPALKPEELRLLRPAMVTGSVLFGVGVVFAFSFILPMGIAFMSFMAQNMMLEMFPDAQSYYEMVIFVTLAIGLTFELPLLEVILLYLGVLNPEWLKKNRRLMFFLILVFAAVITPPDIVTQLSITIPLYLMYEVALIIGTKLRKKKIALEKIEEQKQAEEDERERQEYIAEEAKRRLAERDEEDSEDELSIDKSVYGEDESNSYEDYPFDPYNDENFDPENYDYDEDPYAPTPYIDYGRQARHIPDFSPDWNLNKPDTSFFSPDWDLNENELSPEEDKTQIPSSSSISEEPEK